MRLNGGMSTKPQNNDIIKVLYPTNIPIDAAISIESSSR